MTSSRPALLLILAAALAVAAAAPPDRIALPASPTAPVVDGKIEPGEYAHAVKLGSSLLPLNRGWRAILIPPTVYLTRHGDRVYVCFDNPLREGEYPKSNVFIRDASLICTDPSIEWFLQPPTHEGGFLEYFHFVGNARATWYDSRAEPTIGQAYASWDGAYDYRIGIYPDHWTAEVSLPLTDLGILPDEIVDGLEVRMEFARDGGFSPMSYARCFHRYADHVPVVWRDGVPAVQVQSYGDFAQQHFDPRVDLVGNGKATAVTVLFELLDKQQQVAAGETREVEVPAAGTVSATCDMPLEAEQQGTARITVTSVDGDILYRHTWPYLAKPLDLRPPEKSELKPLNLEAFWAPSYGKVHVLADIYELKSKDPTIVQLSVTGPDGKVLATGRIDHFTNGGGTLNLALGEGLKAGEYRVAGVATDLRGTELARDELTWTRTVYEWEGADRGYSDTVIPPWTPLVANGTTVQVWGRTCTIGDLGLPATIASLQPEPTRGPAERPLLARPIELVAISNGDRVAFTGAGARLLDAGETFATYGAAATSARLDYTMTGRMDYDGYYRVDLTLTPREVQLDSVRVEIPLPGAVVRLLHSTGESKRRNNTSMALGQADGVLWDSASAARNMLVEGNFLPYVWIGDEDRGLAWQADNDATWVLDHAKPCLEVIRDGGEARLVVHLLNRPSVCLAPIRASFGLQATPVRPRAPGGSWRHGMDFRVVYWGAGMNRFGPPGAYPKEKEWAGLESLSEQWHKEDPNVRLFAYQNFAVFDHRLPAGKDFQGEWMMLPGYKGRTQVRSCVDYELWQYQQWYDRCHVVGQYLDVLTPGSSMNRLNGIGWVDEDGDTRAGNFVFEGREYFKRMAHFLYAAIPESRDKQVRIFTHMTSIANVCMLSWSGAWMNGELSGINERNVKDPDAVDLWGHDRGLEFIRAGAIGRQYGVIAVWCTGYHEFGTVFGLHDVPHRWGRADAYCNTLGGTVSETLDMWSPDLRFVPYWHVDTWYTVNRGGRLLASAWVLGDRARIQVSNLNHEDVDADLTLDLAALGVPADCAIVRETDGGAVPHDGGHITSLPIRRHKYEVLVVAPPATLGPAIDGADVAALNTGKRVPELCDTFTPPSDAWVRDFNPAPYFRDNVTDNRALFEPYYGTLHVRSYFGWAHVRRPFARDNVSVRLKMFRPDGIQGGDPALAHPMAALYWGKGQYLKFVMPDDPAGGQVFFAAWAEDAADRKLRRQRFAGPELQRTMWCRFDLKPETVDLYVAIDGKTWQAVGSAARDGRFAGPPAWLILGAGHDTVGTDNDLLRNESPGMRQVDGYYADLVVEEL